MGRTLSANRLAHHGNRADGVTTGAHRDGRFQDALSGYRSVIDVDNDVLQDPTLYAVVCANLGALLIEHGQPTAADFIDYLIADPVVLPRDQEAVFTEKIVILPHCYQINDHCQPIAATGMTRSDAGLPVGPLPPWAMEIGHDRLPRNAHGERLPDRTEILFGRT